MHFKATNVLLFDFTKNDWKILQYFLCLGQQYSWTKYTNGHNSRAGWTLVGSWIYIKEKKDKKMVYMKI